MNLKWKATTATAVVACCLATMCPGSTSDVSLLSQAECAAVLGGQCHVPQNPYQGECPDPVGPSPPYLVGNCDYPCVEDNGSWRCARNSEGDPTVWEYRPGPGFQDGKYPTGCDAAAVGENGQENCDMGTATCHWWATCDGDDSCAVPDAGGTRRCSPGDGLMKEGTVNYWWPGGPDCVGS